MRDIEANRYYTDSASSIVDPALRARNDAAVKPLRDFRRTLNRQEPDCAIAWLTTWAQAGALLGQMSSSQAQYERKWTLASVATTYLSVKRTSHGDVEIWLLRIADEVQRFAERGTKNNHYYWAGLAVGAAGVAARSEPHWDFARRVYQHAMANVGPDGTLPLELARQRRALSYHRFALEPLQRLARLAAARGEQWDEVALERLAALVRRGLADPGLFEALTGHEQEL